LLKGDVAPTLIKRIQFSENNNQIKSEEFSETFYNRGTKVLKSGVEEYKFEKKADLNEVTDRNKRTYMYFIVEKTPYIADLNQFITTDSTQQFKDKKNEELLYFKNITMIEQVSFICQVVIWVLLIILTLMFHKGS
jgi:hypothetical protein